MITNIKVPELKKGMTAVFYGVKYEILEDAYIAREADEYSLATYVAPCRAIDPDSIEWSADILRGWDYFQGNIKAEVAIITN